MNLSGRLLMINAVISYVFSFRFINFVWMVAFCSYGIKRWLVYGLKEAIIEQKNKISRFRNLITITQDQQKKLAEERALQDQKGKELFAKITIWNQSVIDKNNAYEQEQRSLSHQYHKYRISQYHALELLYAKRLLQQDVLDKTVHDVTTLYNNQESQQAFLQHVLGATLKEQE